MKAILSRGFLKKDSATPISLRTKFYIYIPSIGIIFREAWLKALDDKVLSYYFPNAPFPVWTNHPNVKNIYAIKIKSFRIDRLKRKSNEFKFQKFNRPRVIKRRNTI